MLDGIFYALGCTAALLIAVCIHHILALVYGWDSRPPRMGDGVIGERLSTPSAAYWHNKQAMARLDALRGERE